MGQLPGSWSRKEGCESSGQRAAGSGQEGTLVGRAGHDVHSTQSATQATPFKGGWTGLDKQAGTDACLDKVACPPCAVMELLHPHPPTLLALKDSSYSILAGKCAVHACCMPDLH